jgi:hypothetical protein
MSRDIRQTEAYRRGHGGELLVARELMRRGWHIIPSYDYSGAEGNKAPRIEGLRDCHVLPDLDVCRAGKRVWIEVKTKSAASRGRISGELEHGITLHHWQAYRAVERETGSAVWLAIWERDTGQVLVARVRDLPAPRISRMRKAGREEGDMAFFLRASFVVLFTVRGEGA